MYKSTDAGRTWTNLTKTAKGLPAGIYGKIGVAVSPAKPNRVWALVEHDSGGVYRSDDGGATWQFVNGERKLRQRAWYYTHIYADPRDSNMVYALNIGFYPLARRRQDVPAVASTRRTATTTTCGSRLTIRTG